MFAMRLSGLSVDLPRHLHPLISYSLRGNTHNGTNIDHVHTLHCTVPQQQVSPAELKKLRNEAPHRVVIKLFTHIDQEPMILKTSFQETVGTVYYKITVEVCACVYVGCVCVSVSVILCACVY